MLPGFFRSSEQSPETLSKSPTCSTARPRSDSMLLDTTCSRMQDSHASNRRGVPVQHHRHADAQQCTAPPATAPSSRPQCLTPWHSAAPPGGAGWSAGCRRWLRLSRRSSAGMPPGATRSACPAGTAAKVLQPSQVSSKPCSASQSGYAGSHSACSSAGCQGNERGLHASHA